MKEMLMTIEFIETISCRLYGKGIFFYDYDDMEWYSRIHGHNVSYEEVLEWLEENIVFESDN